MFFTVCRLLLVDDIQSELAEPLRSLCGAMGGREVFIKDTFECRENDMILWPERAFAEGVTGHPLPSRSGGPPGKGCWVLGV
jgi:hypothetical protein